MKYQVQENCLTIYLAREVDHHNAEEMKREAAQEDVVFRERAFIPTEGVYQGQVCFGLEFAPLRKDLDFLPTALTLLRQTARMYPETLITVSMARR